MSDYILVLRPEYAAARGLFSRRGHAGYTNRIDEAGRFSENEAYSLERSDPDKYVAVPVETTGEITRLQGEVAELRQELDEDNRLRERLAALLTGVANALRGEPEPLHAHSWHDLPERARAAVAERDSLRDVALALRQHLALFCGPDDAIAQALFERADAVICGAGAVLKAGRDQGSEEDIHATVDRMRSITNKYHPNGLPARKPERSCVYEALTIQALRIAAAQERWGLDGPGIIREFVGELGDYERALAKREEIRIDYLDEPGDDTAEGEG